MSIDATRWAWQQRDITPMQKLVLLSMADRAGEEHRCWPSNARLCQDTGLDRKTVYACIEKLESLNIIRAHRQPGRQNVYELLGVQGREDTQPRHASALQTSTENGTSAEIATSPQIGTSTKSGTSPKNGLQPVPKTGQDQSQKRDTNLSRTSKRNSQRARVGPESPAHGKAQGLPSPSSASLHGSAAAYIPPHEREESEEQLARNRAAARRVRELRQLSKNGQ